MDVEVRLVKEELSESQLHVALAPAGRHDPDLPGDFLVVEECERGCSELEVVQFDFGGPEDMLDSLRTLFHEFLLPLQVSVSFGYGSECIYNVVLVILRELDLLLVSRIDPFI